MRGIILAGGNGTRLYPSTLAVSKQLLPVYNKPMIYYPLSTVMLAGINDILLITKPNDTSHFHNLLGDGTQFGISINYAVQANPTGVPDAISIGRHFLGQEQAFLVLGDNIVFGRGLTSILKNAKASLKGGSVFSYSVNDPERYGIINLDRENNILSLNEKPKKPESNLAVTGHYMLANDAVDRVKDLKKSSRGETEIVDLLSGYLSEQKLTHNNFGRGFAWFDCGTHSSLQEASSFVETIESRQSNMVACLEEIALYNGWLSQSEVEEISNTKYLNTLYGKYLSEIVRDY